MDIIVPKGKYSSKVFQVEPTIMWFTTTEIGINVWTYRRIKVRPSFESYGENKSSLRKQVLANQFIEANTPTIIKFGCLVDLTNDYLKAPPQTETIVRLECVCGKAVKIMEFKYQIPKYWAGPDDKNVPDFNVLVGSCWKLPGDYQARISEFPFNLYKLFNEYTLTSSLNIVLGDNIYLSEYLYNTESGLLERYKTLFNFPELKGSWSNVPWSAINDDHDLGLNDETYGGQGMYLCKSVFEKMWQNNSKNPISPLIWSMFRYDLCFIGLDDVSFKTNFGDPESTILGKQQLDWLKQSLQSVRNTLGNPFIFICVGTPFIPPNIGNFFSYPDQIIIENMIRDLNLKNVFFLTGDTHLSDVSVKNISYGLNIQEIRCSPVSTYPRNSVTRPNPYRVPDTLVETYNFGKLSITGKYGERTLEYVNVIKDGSTPVKYSYKLEL